MDLIEAAILKYAHLAGGLNLVMVREDAIAHLDGKKTLVKMGGKRPGKKCGKGYVSADKKCKEHEALFVNIEGKRNVKRKLTSAGKKSAEELAAKVRARKGMKALSGSILETKEQKFTRLANTLNSNPSKDEFIAWKKEVAAMSPSEAKEYYDFKQQKRKKEDQGRRKAARESAKQAKAKIDEYMNSSKENRAVLDLRKKQEEAKRMFQQIGEGAEPLFEALEEEVVRVSKAAKYRNLADRDQLNAYNSSQPLWINLESGPTPASGVRELGTPWKIRSIVADDPVDYVIAAAKIEDTGSKGRRKIVLTTSEDILYKKPTGSLEVEFDATNKENSNRARRMIREITQGRARHTTIDEMVSAIDGTPVPPYRKTVSPDEMGVNYKPLII